MASMSPVNGEPLVLALFLQNRCDEGKYGLRYYESDRTKICIPWPNATRKSHEVFQLFQEWAVLASRKRRHSTDVAAEKATDQKHRFRNALKKAAGLSECPGLSKPDLKVYEIKQLDGHKLQSPLIMVSPFSTDSQNMNQSCQLEPDSDINMLDELMDAVAEDDLQQQQEQPQQEPFQCIKQPTTYQENQETYYHPQQQDNQLQSQTQQQVMFQDQQCLQQQQQQQQFNAIANPQQSMRQQYQEQQPQHSQQPKIISGAHSCCIKVFYCGALEMKKNLDYSVNAGCRFFYGDDALNGINYDMIKQIGEYSGKRPEMYFGPADTFIPLQLPDPTYAAKNKTQLTKMNEILKHATRGLVLVFDYDNNLPTPNVEAVRLCQTKVFPYQGNIDGDVLNKLKTEGLQRQQSVRVFDREQFHQQVLEWKENKGQKPETTISFTIGQKPINNRGLITVQLTISAAEAFINQNLPSITENSVCLSSKNSADIEAEFIRNNLNKMSLT